MRDTQTSFIPTSKRSGQLAGIFVFLLLASAFLAHTVQAVTAANSTNTSASDLVVSKSVDVTQPLPDQIVTYSIQIYNSGVVSATNGTLNDDLDSNLTFIGPVSIEGSLTGGTPGAPPAIASGLTISPSTAVTISFPVRINSELTAGIEIKNTAVAQSDEYDPASSNEVNMIVGEATEVIWKQRSSGIHGGRINVLVIDPQNTDILYAGTPAGIFKSKDGGLKWAAANTGLENLQVESLAIDPLHGDLLYAGTQNGLFKSSDGGSSWAPANIGLTGSEIRSLAVDPGLPALLYAGTETGVFKSSDGGNSWTETNAGLTDLQISTLAIDPRRSSTLYAGTPTSGVFKSSDSGRSWAPANSGLTNLNIHLLHPDPLNSNALYAGTDAGLFKSENGGSNWSAAGADLAGTAVLSLAIDPTNSKILFAGTEKGIAQSTNSGSSWTPVREGETTVLAVDPFNTLALYAGTTDEGVQKSSDGGANWQWANLGINGGKILALAIDPADSNLIFSGTPGSGVFKSSDGGGQWTAANDGLADQNIHALAIPSGSGTVVYAGTDGGVFKSSDDAGTWIAANTGLTNSAIRALLVHPTKSQFLYAGTAGGGLFRSNNGANSWTAANSGLTNAHINALAIDLGDSQILYAGTQGGVFKSNNGGSSWIAVNNGLTISDVQALVVDPHNGQNVYAAGPGGLFKSSNGGGSWEESGLGLEDTAVQALAFDPANSAILYAATAEDGVFRSTGSGYNWTAVNEDLATRQVHTLALPSSNTLFAGTGGGGIYSSGPHLALNKQVDNPNPLHGDPLLYTIQITNTGTLSISSGTVHDYLNGNLKVTGPVTFAGRGASATTNNPPKIIKDLAIEPGGTATITLPVELKTGLSNGTVIPNTAVADAPQLHSPASSEIAVTAYRPNKLQVGQNVDESNPQPGQTVNFTITIKNSSGSQGVGGIDVMNNLDSNLTFIGPVEITGSSGTTGSPPLIASGMGLGAGKSLTVKFPARVNGDVLPGTIIDNIAEVTSTPWPVPLSSQITLVVGDPPARHIFVDEQAAAGTNDGTSWENAYTNLQDALLNAGSGSEIWVADGVYYPDSGSTMVDNDPAATFHLRSGVAIYGGFNGSEAELEERDPEANLTILSGDIDNNDSLGCAADNIEGSNSMHVVTGGGADASALLDGFTITAGNARGTDGDQHGGGLYNKQGSPSLANIIFCGNSANGSGGGMFNDAGSPTLHEVKFVDNAADAVNGRGGGMASINGSQTVLEDVEFSGNQAYYGGGIFTARSKTNIDNSILSMNKAVWGGGVFNSDGSDGTVTGVSFTSNEASGGGGMANDNSSPTLQNVTFAGNAVIQRGGGLSSANGSPKLANPVFSGNLAEAQANGQQSWGGGLFISGGQPILASATISGNWASAKGTRPEDEGLGGGLFVDAGKATINNSIFWNNEGDRTPDLLVASGGVTEISSSRLDGCPQYSLCDNLVDADPQFAVPVDPTSAPTVGGNLSLWPGSALVDAGDNALIPAGVLTDRAGQARIYNGIVDMGAFELSIACPEGEASRLYVDGSVTGSDNSGLDWENALDKLSYAFALAEGCQDSDINEIWVAAGQYVPNDGNYAAAGAQDSSFNLSNGLAVYGGFAGTELILEERDWLANLTILSGDIEGDDLVDSAGMVTDTAKIVGSNSYHVVSSVGNDETAVLDGFSINGGQANGDAAAGDDSGGGVYIEASSPTLRHLTLLANTADDGGGMANISSSSPILTNLLFSANKATYFGGGVFNQSSSPEMTNIALLDNQATSGGGMFNAISSPKIVNATFAGNQADSTDSVDFEDYFPGARQRMEALGGTTGTTGFGGGMYNLNNSRPEITNSIFWQNEDGNGSGTASATIGNDAGSIPLIAYSLVQASGGSGAGWDGSMGFDQGQNIDADPLFIATGNRRLQPNSPAVDAGDNTANNSTYDLDGKPRITDGINDGESVIDLGAYETTLVAISISSTPDTTSAKVGDTVSFTYVISNTGKVKLIEITAIDENLGEITLGETTLDAGASTSGSLSYTLEESDIGTLVSKVTVIGKTEAGAEVTAGDIVAVEVKPGVYHALLPILFKE